MTMTPIEELILKEDKKNPGFAAEVAKEGRKLQASVEVMKLRESLGLSQREFAKKVGKPQSTISRIESGNMNVSFELLAEIGAKVGKQLEIKFI